MCPGYARHQHSQESRESWHREKAPLSVIPPVLSRYGGRQLQTPVFMAYEYRAQCFPSEPQFPHMETIIGPESTLRAEEDNACKLPMDVCTVCDKPAHAGKSGAWGHHALIRTASKML